MWWRTPKKPDLHPEVLAEFELHGVDAVRAVLSSSSDGVSGADRQCGFRRGEMQDWLKWKAAVTEATETRRFRTNVALAVAGIVAALLIAAWQFGWFK